jgi:hypothetical protein
MVDTRGDRWRRLLKDSFYCPRKEGIIHDLNYCRHVCPRHARNCEYFNNRQYLRPL